MRNPAGCVGSALASAAWLIAVQCADFGSLLVLVGCSMVWMIPELFYQGLRAQRPDVPVPVIATHAGL